MCFIVMGYFGHRWGRSIRFRNTFLGLHRVTSKLDLSVVLILELTRQKERR